MLCDSACLPVNHMGIADGIQKGGFTVVNVTHYAHNRRPGNEGFCCILYILQHLSDYILFFLRDGIVIHLHGKLTCCLKIQFGIYCYHLACQKQLLNNDGRLNLHSLCQIVYADKLGNLDYLWRKIFLLWCRSRRTHRCRAFAAFAVLLVRTIAALIWTTAALAGLTAPIIIEFAVFLFFGVIISVLILRSAVFCLAKLYNGCCRNIHGTAAVPSLTAAAVSSLASKAALAVTPLASAVVAIISALTSKAALAVTALASAVVTIISALASKASLTVTALASTAVTAVSSLTSKASLAVTALASTIITAIPPLAVSSLSAAILTAWDTLRSLVIAPCILRSPRGCLL